MLALAHARCEQAQQQREKSWYMLLFQFPGVAKCWFTEDNWANFRDWARHPDADQVITELEATGSLTPGLSWYRANIPPESWLRSPARLPPVQAPTMGIWSSADGALTEIQMTDSAENVAGSGDTSASTAQATGCSSTHPPR